MRTILAALAMFLAGTASAQAPAPLPADADVEAILDRRIDTDRQGVGMVVAVVEPGAEPRFIAHGPAEAGGGEPLGPDSVFEIGSLTKVFTALLLAAMAVRGEVGLDDPVARYLPEGVTAPERNGRPITLRQLASQTSGLPRLPGNIAPADPADPYADYTEGQLHAFLSDYVLPRDPGTLYEYSNLGFGLLGHALSLAAGMDYEALLKARILDPLGLADTAIIPTASMEARLARGHDAALQPVSRWHFDVLAGAGALLSTPRDMARFMAHASGGTNSPLAEAFALMLAEPQPTPDRGLSIGLGWMILSRPDGDIVFHNGITGGFHALAAFRRSDGAASLLLANAQASVPPEDIALHLLDATLPLAQPPAPRQAIAIDPAVLENYAGRYAITPGFVLTVTAEDGRLFVEPTGQPRSEVFPQSETTFFYTIVDAQLSFEIGPDGRAVAVILHQNGVDQRGERLE